ncbi:hypothetical protein HYX04_02490 [Candidatus Woesearchaeota archaeon]|nr:hypothetical protein [Candidatus Woesearchaeota archaeon]
MEINWIEDQPSIRPVRVQIEQTSLIPDLVMIIQKHNLKNARGHKQIEFPRGTTHVYECAVVKSPELDSKILYHIFIKQLGLHTNDAIGEIYKQ